MFCSGTARQRERTCRRALTGGFGLKETKMAGATVRPWRSVRQSRTGRGPRSSWTGCAWCRRPGTAEPTVRTPRRGRRSSTSTWSATRASWTGRAGGAGRYTSAPTWRSLVFRTASCGTEATSPRHARRSRSTGSRRRSCGASGCGSLRSSRCCRRPAAMHASPWSAAASTTSSRRRGRRPGSPPWKLIGGSWRSTWRACSCRACKRIETSSSCDFVLRRSAQVSSSFRDEDRLLINTRTPWHPGVWVLLLLSARPSL
mmetsp:Transcript_19877/g.40417  ORF Transcript_19877/g.40417 Transcript_19877/m.40417 type:complete len:258 (-) Transcript_19877:38-811(-)